MKSVMDELFVILNRLLERPKNPGGRESVEAYIEIQYQKSANIIRRYKPYNDVTDKIVLDLGCGPGGHSMYYASQGASFVTGLDINLESIKIANSVSARKGIENAGFLLGDAYHIPYPSNSIDIAFMNSVIEHLYSPELALDETFRVLKIGGVLNLSFPLYHSPYGAHLYDYIYVPWAHLIFSEDVLLQSWKNGYKIDFENGTNRIFGGIEHVTSAESIDDLFYVSRLGLKEWENLIHHSPFRILRKDYRKMRYWGRLAGIFPPLSKYITWSISYVLQKN